MQLSRLLRRPSALAVIVLGAGLWSGCSDRPADAPTGPPVLPELAFQGQPDIAAAIAAQRRHTPALMRMPGVVGTAVGLLPNGRAAVRVFLLDAAPRPLPSTLDGVPVAPLVTGRFMAGSDPTKKLRPAELGFSVGHPDITAGTIGARVTNGVGNVFILSNNHVLANSNDASIGDPILQPGAFDGGTLADQIATLSAYQPIDFSLSGANTMDAAIAMSSTADLSNTTPTDDGYGVPNAAIYGDADLDGTIDNPAALLGLVVQKYGRTTKLTQGQVTGINATVEICYEVLYVFCIKSAIFVDQLIIEPGAFSDGGDSGSLIVTADTNEYPVALLFAGSETQTIANRIDLILTHFGVTVDGKGGTPPPPPPPPTPITDVAIADVSAPASVTQGDVVDVLVTVENVGTENVTVPFDVTLRDATDAVDIGTETVSGLSAGHDVVITFSWSTAPRSLGSHTLSASHTLGDENGDNDAASTAVTVNDPSAASTVHVGDLDGWGSNDGKTWSATVEIAVHDGNHIPINGATVTGTWSESGLNANVCTTGELGGNGTCIVLFPGLRKRVRDITFTVTSVTLPDGTYQPALNHDVDGSSDGTTVTVNKP